MKVLFRKLIKIKGKRAFNPYDTQEIEFKFLID